MLNLCKSFIKGKIECASIIYDSLRKKKKLYGIQHKALEIIAGSEATTLIESLEVN